MTPPLLVALAIVAGIVILVTHDRQVQEREMAPLMWIMLFSEHGINFNDYPASFKRGTYVQRRLYEKTLDEETLARIPVGKRPIGAVMRSEVAVLDMPPLAKVPNRGAVLLDAATPEAPDA